MVAQTGLNRALILNADYRPLSISPLSTWGWEDTVKAVLADRVDVVEVYDRVVRSPSRSIPLPSVVALRHYENLNRPAPLTRANLFTRDNGMCQYCQTKLATSELTFEHVVPLSRGGATSWLNLVAACEPCNTRKRDRTPQEAKMRLIRQPFHPTVAQLNGKNAYDRLQMDTLHPTWFQWLGLTAPPSTKLACEAPAPMGPQDVFPSNMDSSM